MFRSAFRLAILVVCSSGYSQQGLSDQVLYAKPGTTLVAEDNREPYFYHAGDTSAAEQKLEMLTQDMGAPNILVVLIDDMAWGDIGVYGGGIAVGAATPNLDQLAREGLRLTSAYAQPTCSPSRATLLTGRLPIRHKVFSPPQVGESIGGGLTDEVTLATLLSESGYNTAMAGKWHLGEAPAQQPQYNGFDEYYGFFGSVKNYTQFRDAHIAPWYANDPLIQQHIENLEGYSDAMVYAKRNQPAEAVYPLGIEEIANADIDLMRFSVAYIESQQSSDQPWFLYHAFGKVHYDNYPAEGFAGASAAKGVYQDAVVEADYIVGQLIDALDRTGQSENTLVIFTSDNGVSEDSWPDSGYSPWRGAKGSTWEGGIRVPLIMRWPDAILPGRESDGLFDLADIFPTVLKLANTSLPSDRFIDGVDQTPFILAAEGQSTRGAVFSYMGQNLSAYRVGPFKQHFFLREPLVGAGIAGDLNGSTLTRTTGPTIFHLYLDPRERRPIGTKLAITNGYMREFLARHLNSL